MATVYSLICWGGRTGKTVSIAASTDVVTLTGHGLRDGTKLWPSGTLPSELNTSMPVYARSTGANTFTLHTSSAGAIANTGQILFAGSSTYAAVTLKSDLVASPATALSAYGLSDLSRWGASGSERIYDGLVSWITARSSAAIPLNDEVCELGEAFTEATTSQAFVSIPAGAIKITSTVNGKRSAGFHKGKLPPASPTLSDGYIFSKNVQDSNNAVSIQKHNTTIDGFSVLLTGAAYNIYAVEISGTLTGCVVQGMLIVGKNDATSTGMAVAGQGTKVINNLCMYFTTGFLIANYTYGIVVANNTSVKNTNGFFNNSSPMLGYYYNNLSVGNTTNWTTYGLGSVDFASNNAGLSGEAWMSGTGSSRITMATTDFANFSGNDFKAASASSPQVESGSLFYGAQPVDVAGDFRPNYMNGSAAYYDIGAYEFDHGYGPWPASHVLTLTNVAVGSRVFIRDQADTVTHFDQIAAASTVSATITVYGDSRDNWRIKVRKASGSPNYIPYETLMTATAGGSSLYVSQIPDE